MRLWIADDRHVAHLTSAGQLIASFSAPAEVRRVQVALDRSLWLLGKRNLWHFDFQGKLLASYVLGRHLANDARYFEVDSLGGIIWLADDKELAQLKLVNPVDPPLRIRLGRDLTGFALDPLTGNVWVAQKEELLAYSRAGVLVHTADLQSRNLRKPENLAFDAVSRSLWAGTERSVNRFTDTGEFVIRFAAKDGDEALGVPAFKVTPTLTQLRPPQNALTNSPQPLFTLSYGAACNSVVCALPNDYLAGYQLSATLNSLAVGSQFLFELSTGLSSFTPAARLPEGANIFSAQVKDGFGLLSNTVTNTFTVDTIAPSFINVTPLDGAVIPTPQTILQGTIDDPSATVVLEGTGLSQTGASFSFPVILQPGANTFTLSAVDGAGNRATVQRTLIRASLSLNISSPAAGASVSGSTILVSGSVEGGSNVGVTVNGVAASIIGDQFYATVPLQTGANEFTVIATTLDGASVQKTISVNSSGLAAVEVTADLITGVAPLKVAFGVNSTLTVQSIQADFDGNGTTDFATTNRTAPIAFTYSQPGVYFASFIVSTLTNGFRNDFAQTVPIVVIDPVALDQQLKAQWQEFAGALAARDKAKAMQFLSSSAQDRYGPVFDALVASLPEIASSISAPERELLTGTYAEYYVTRRVTDGSLRVFLIYFFRDAEGVWRLEL